MRKKLAAVMLAGHLCLDITFAAPAQEDTAYSPQMQAFERHAAAFHQTGSLSAAYHAARLAFAMRAYDRAAKWLTVLDDVGWKLGLDPMDFTADAVPPQIEKLMNRLHAAVPDGRGFSPTVVTFSDPALVPESIAFLPAGRAIVAGSLARSELSVASLQSTAEPIAFSLPKGDWGVFYGIKYHADRGELWVLHNKRVEDEMRGQLSVIAANGSLVKQYRTNNVPAVELNDLCFAGDSVFVTDSTAAKIYIGDLNGSILSLHYEHEDISYPNGIACNDENNNLYVAHAYGVAAVGKRAPDQHAELAAPAGFSLGGIDGLYLWKNRLIGVQNYMGAPKVLRASLEQSTKVGDIALYDVRHPAFHIPTTGFVRDDCFYYLANSSLDALAPGGGLREGAGVTPAQVLGLHLLEPGGRCNLD